jgi:hydrogenase assembly chaperone HypC/HupF
MCLVLPARVIALSEHVAEAEIELPDGARATVATTLVPDVAVGSYVLVDRGMALKAIDADEAQAILALYAELDGLLSDESEAEPWPSVAAHE